MFDQVTAWAQDVVAGKVIAGPHIRNTCARHLRDLETGHERGLHFDVEASERAIALFPKYFRLNGGKFEGKPFVLHVSQAFRVGSIFGWKKPNGKRRFRRMYDEEGKGNGKSPLLAGLGMIGLMFDNEPRAEIYAAASKKDQAMVLFKDAVAIVEQSPAIAAKVKKSGVDPVWALTYISKRGGKCEFKPISSDEGKSGPRPHFALIDELHEHRSADTVNMLEAGFKFREQPFIAMATNSGTGQTGVCWDERTHAVKVAAGEVDDDETFSFVCSLDEGDDWLTDESCWVKVNPLIDVILDRDYLRKRVAMARKMPSKRNSIARLNFCIWTEGETVWITPEVWKAAENPDLSLDDLVGRRCWDSIDIGLVSDLSARAKAFENGVNAEGKPKYILWVMGYTPKDGLADRAERDQTPYDVWVEQGYLTATPGRLVRLDHLAHDLTNETLLYESQGLCYDNWNYQKFQEELDLISCPLPVFRHPQGVNHVNKDAKVKLYMPDSIDAFERLLLEDRVEIFVNPALRAAVMSVAMWESPTGLRMFEKRKAVRRIDMAVAAAMALGFATINEKTDAPTVYKKRGLLIM